MSLSEQWASRPWNTDTGRLVWWLGQHRKTGSYTSRQAVLAFWRIALRDAGEVATRAAVTAAGLTLPAWLEKPAQQGPADAAGRHRHAGPGDAAGQHRHAGPADAAGRHRHAGPGDAAGQHRHAGPADAATVESLEKAA